MIIIILIWIVLGLLSACLVLYIVKYKLKFTEIPQQEISEQYQPFLRIDRKNWNLFQIGLGAIIFLPLRMLFINILICMLAIICKLFMCFNEKNDLPKWKSQILTYITKLFSKLFLFGCGFYSVQYKQVKIKDYCSDYPANQYQQQDPKQIFPISISNHISWIDTIIIISMKATSFLSRGDLTNAPLWGTVSKAIQCIAFDKTNSNARKQVMHEIINRAQLIEQGQNYLPLHIYPEGAITNGAYLLQFQKGAFVPLKPIKIYCIKYNYKKFNPSTDSIGIFYNALLTLSQWKNSATFYEFDVFNPKYLNLQGENAWQIYAQKLQSIISKCLDIKISNSDYITQINCYNDMRKMNDTLNNISQKKNL